MSLNLKMFNAFSPCNVIFFRLISIDLHLCLRCLSHYTINYILINSIQNCVFLFSDRECVTFYFIFVQVYLNLSALNLFLLEMLCTLGCRFSRLLSVCFYMGKVGDYPQGKTGLFLCEHKFLLRC